MIFKKKRKKTLNLADNKYKYRQIYIFKVNSNYLLIYKCVCFVSGWHLVKYYQGKSFLFFGVKSSRHDFFSFFLLCTWSYAFISRLKLFGLHKVFCKKIIYAWMNPCNSRIKIVMMKWVSLLFFFSSSFLFFYNINYIPPRRAAVLIPVLAE